MSKKKVNYAEGDCFAVPLRDSGFARGVVARMNGKGAIFGYFFGPRMALACEGEDFSTLVPDNAILLRDFGDLGLLNGKWTILGKMPEWNRDEWPMPPLIRVDETEGRAWLSHYDDSSFECLMEEEVDPSLVSSYPQDGTSGYGAVEIRLTKLLQ